MKISFLEKNVERNKFTESKFCLIISEETFAKSKFAISGVAVQYCAVLAVLPGR